MPPWNPEPWDQFGAVSPSWTATLPPGRQDHDFFSPDSVPPHFARNPRVPGRPFDRDGDGPTTLREGDRDRGRLQVGGPAQVHPNVAEQPQPLAH